MADELVEAIVAAHSAAECGDFYCGCWDQTAYPGMTITGHTERFLAALRALGYDVVKITEERP